MIAPPVIDDTALLAFAAEIGSAGPVMVRGGGTQWDVGGAPDSDIREVSAPTGIVEFRPDEMTVCVRAGTTVAALHAVLAEHGQRTALPDGSVPGGSPNSTVGGTIAVGRSPVTRLGDGHIRDAVLQLHYVAADGQLVTAGGPTVKNVTGFDMCRVLVGSLGTLGCIGDAILRTRPRPEHEQWAKFADAEPETVLNTAKTATAILWDGSSVWARLCGHRVDVEDDLVRLPASYEVPPPDLPPFRWSRRPKDLHRLPNETGRFIAEIGVGVVHCERPDPNPPPVPASVAALNRRVRELFDPNRRFNPGRSVGQL
ncbi:MAG: FAD-binding protein [Acidimicrobiaceae bacterium]|nr:FAD-binding protein [Acidimicrobiaceae bacterium]MXW62111.1 FAD-binding protein [Acidimicrobiaceae bacterium]MYC42629.1 FAD-binding protein [Acidimicrobiaceae bacterium]MYD07740.1 FAD-binding protein [Acidimicrobiaceae bacterium]MYI57160.1 FAD-binding protein [Acidimicrobiaceae bacterium]